MPLQQSVGGQGLVSIEAENYDANVTQGGHAWAPNNTPGYSGTGALWARPNVGTNVNQGYVSNSPRLDFQVNFVATGTHYLWIRALGATKYDDSVHAGLDGNAITSSDRLTINFGKSWQWSRSTIDGSVATIKVKTPGLHTVNVWMREDGLILDKLVLTTDAAYRPADVGPPESPRVQTETPPQVWPTNGWDVATAAEMGMRNELLEQARDYALTAGGSGFITRGGKLVMSWGNTTQRYDLKSTTKSFGVAAVGLALQDGRLVWNDLAIEHLPSFGIPPTTNASTGWLPSITLQQLANHTAGFDKAGGFISLLYQPGSTWSYSDGGANWLADVLTVAFGDDLNTVMFNRVFSKLGIKTTDLFWRKNAYRGDTINGIKRREFGSGISASADAMARLGYLYLRRGIWDGERILPESFIDQVRQPVASTIGLPASDPVKFPHASEHYGLLWWNNADGALANVPRDAYWSWGLKDSLIVVIPSLDVVITRAGDSGWRSGWSSDYTVLAPFIEPIVRSVQ
ncbi:MAG: serine hydrolase [Gammaproteobacteria bacterium]|nr:serine hydrolase [Gammaproteobacteria bacterium]